MVETSIQAVSPLSGVGVFAASWASATPAVMASVPRLASAATPAFFKLSILMFQSPLWTRESHRGPYSASPSVSPVRIRTTCSSGVTKIFPSPI